MMASRFAGAVRQFSSSAVRHAEAAKAPIQVFGIEGRYAHALFAAASKEKKLDVVEKDLQAFEGVLAKDIPLKSFIVNPSLQRTQKQAVMADVMKKLKYSNLTANLFDAIAENGRLNKTESIIKAFNTIMGAYRGEVSCTVTTAKALDKSQMKELQGALNGFLEAGQSLQITMQVDPAIVGGMVVNIGDKYVDMSMATKIKTYTNLISEAV